MIDSKSPYSLKESLGYYYPFDFLIGLVIRICQRKKPMEIERVWWVELREQLGQVQPTGFKLYTDVQNKYWAGLFQWSVSIPNKEHIFSLKI